MMNDKDKDQISVREENVPQQVDPQDIQECLKREREYKASTNNRITQIEIAVKDDGPTSYGNGITYFLSFEEPDINKILNGDEDSLCEGYVEYGAYASNSDPSVDYPCFLRLYTLILKRMVELKREIPTPTE